MTDYFNAPNADALANFGWSDFFNDQLCPDDAGCIPARIATVHRARMGAITLDGPIRLVLPVHTNTANYAVGDWILADPSTHLLHRRLDRKSVLERRGEGGQVAQLTAANVDTLLIVTSCNADFSPARLERYLAMANQAGITPVIVLTKADTAADPHDFARQAQALQRHLAVIPLNARTGEAGKALAPWCGIGQTVALVGSSGVGKSTLLNTLTGQDAQLTGSIREGDSKGRHTTTSRSLHTISEGGWVIDTPGIRTLHASDMGVGLQTLFAEISELAPLCKFRDCTHAHEPGCAVQAALAAGTLDPDRFARWRKLMDENITNTPAQSPFRRGKKR